MSIWDWLGFGEKRKSARQPLEQDTGDSSESKTDYSGSQVKENVRRWDAAQTHRLNVAHWQNARQGQHINDDLACSLKTLRARCVYEAFANPWVEGVIKTHSIDVITPSGPTLVVESSNDEFNRRFKESWESWWSSPEIAGELSGVDLLRRWNGQRWTKGIIFGQFVTDPDSTSADVVSLRIRDIDCDRLETPADRAGYESTQFGIQRSKKTGRPVKFFVRKDNARTTVRHSIEYDELTAENVLFAFESYEPDQATGFPRLASCLEEIAQLRDYDTEVLDAARQFANNAMAFYTDSVEFVTMASAKMPTGTVEMKRGTGKYIHPGYKPIALNSTQPAANYKDFRFEKLRSLGRPVSMPLLLILLSAEESNFSQSKIDVNIFYERGLRAERFWWQSHVLNPILKRFSQELLLSTREGRFIVPRMPSDAKFSWHWEQMPQADEKKHYETVALKRDLGLTTWSHDLAAEGTDREAIKRSIERDKADLESLGMSTSPNAASAASAGNAANDSGQQEQDQQANQNEGTNANA